MRDMPREFWAAYNPDISREMVTAVENLVAQLNNIDGDSPWHAVHVWRPDPNKPPLIKVHIRPGHEHKWRDRTAHFGFPLELHPWPASD